MKELTYKRGALSFSYAMSESGDLPLVLLHGLSFNRRTWAPLIECLPSDLKIFTLDFRGHGESSRVTPPYLFADLVDDVIAFLHQCVGQPAWIYGHSLGGAVAMAVASKAPETVFGVINGDNFLTKNGHSQLISQAIVRCIWDNLRTIGLAKPGLQEAAETMACLPLPIPESSEEVYLGDLPGNSSKFLHMWAECLLDCDPEVVSILFDPENIAAFDGEAYMASINCPLMLLQANVDLGGSLSDEDIAIGLGLKPDMEVVQLPECGHFLHLQNPVPIAKAINGIIARHP